VGMISDLNSSLEHISPWSVFQSLKDFHSRGEYGRYRTPDGGIFTLKEESELSDLLSVQSQCICTYIFMLK
jgi:hypothetical protein